jgi:sigma-B regulation protein RsbU (phosphoserine phosphatase)
MMRTTFGFNLKLRWKFFVILIDRDPPLLTWVRAGHDPAILYDPKKDVFKELQGEGIPLGADDSWVYAQSTKAGKLKEQIILTGDIKDTIG